MFYIYIKHKHTHSHKHTLSRSPVGRGSVVDIATGYNLDDQGVGFRVPLRVIIMSSPWGLPSLLSIGEWGLFPEGKVVRA